MASYDGELVDGLGVSEAVGDGTPLALEATFKGYIPLSATTAVQTITDMTLSTAGTNAVGGSLASGDKCLFVTGWGYYSKSGTLAVSINGTIINPTVLATSTANDFYDALASVETFTVPTTPTEIRFGANVSGVLAAPAQGTNSAGEKGRAYILVFSSELELSGSEVATAVIDGNALPAATLTGSPGAFSFFVATGYASENAWTGRVPASNVIQLYGETYWLLLGWGWEESFTTNTLPGLNSTTGSVSIQMSLAPVGGSSVVLLDDAAADTASVAAESEPALTYGVTFAEALSVDDPTDPGMVLLETLADAIATLAEPALQPSGTTHEEVRDEAFGVLADVVARKGFYIVVDEIVATLATSLADVFKIATAADTVRLTDVVRHLHQIAAVAGDALAASDAAVSALGVRATDQLRLADAPVPVTTYALLVAEALRISERVRTGYTATATDTVIVGYAAMALRALTITERLGVSEVLSPTTSYRLTVAERVRLLDAAIRFFGADASDTIMMTDLVAPLRRTSGAVPEVVTVADSPAGALVLRVTATDTVELDAVQQLQMIFAGTLFDGLSVEAMYVSPTGNFTTWAINTRAGAVTEYTDYAFNSFAKLGNKYIAADSSGLYELAGDDDAGQSIVADIKGGFLQFNSSRFAGMKAAYLGIRGGGEFFLKLEAASGEVYTYKIKTEDMATTKVWIGKGLRHRYLSYELISTGQDFDLESIEFVPMLAQRRV
jgi:hypothetical protein